MSMSRADNEQNQTRDDRQQDRPQTGQRRTTRSRTDHKEKEETNKAGQSTDRT